MTVWVVALFLGAFFFLIYPFMTNSLGLDDIFSEEVKITEKENVRLYKEQKTLFQQQLDRGEIDNQQYENLLLESKHLLLLNTQTGQNKLLGTSSSGLWLLPILLLILPIVALPIYQEIGAGQDQKIVSLIERQSFFGQKDTDQLQVNNQLIGNHIKLPFPSVGATENIMMAAVKAKGKTVIENAAKDAVTAAYEISKLKSNKDKKLDDGLRRIIISLREVNDIFSRMPEKCDPYVYYHRVRPFIFGTKDNPDLKKGLVYENQFNNKPQFFRGETGAQSSIMPFLDGALGIYHTKDHLRHYLNEMRDYMPPEHRSMIEEVENISKAKELIDDSKSLTNKYNKCLEEIRKFRLTKRNRQYNR